MSLKKSETLNLSSIRLLDKQGLMAYTSLGEMKAVEFATSVGARKKIGGQWKYDREILDKAIDQIPAE